MAKNRDPPSPSSLGPSKSVLSESMKTAWNAVASVCDFLIPPKAGQNEDHPLKLTAVPGLMTLLDVALFQSVSAQLTATLCSSHALLKTWLDLKCQARLVLQELASDEEQQQPPPNRRLAAESFARLCLESASDAIERLGTDKLAQSANLSDPYETSATSGSHVLSGVGSQGIVSGVLESKEETGRRNPSQRRKDCWESPRLLCPDYVWADDAYLTCQRLLRNLHKHIFYSSDVETVMGNSNQHHPNPLSPGCEREATILLQLVRDDIPVRLHQFRIAVESESVVSKRLYLVKCEIRAPFRAFLEAHQSVQRAPPIDLVEEYLQLTPSKREGKQDCVKTTWQGLLETPTLVEALGLEQRCEEMEIAMARALFPFTELARILEHKRAHLKPVSGVLLEEDVASIQDTVQRLKCILCRKAGPETSTGIRPLLLDLQGVPREEDTSPDSNVQASNKETTMRRLEQLVAHLQCLGTLCKSRNAFWMERKTDVDLPSSVVKGCADFDHELFRCQFEDWYDMVLRQHELAQRSSLEELSEKIRRSEMEMSIAFASEQSLKMVRQRLELIATDRQKRFEILKDMVEEVCLREMNLHIQLDIPEQTKILELPETSAYGVFGLPLQISGELLPIG